MFDSMSVCSPKPPVHTNTLFSNPVVGSQGEKGERGSPGTGIRGQRGTAGPQGKHLL